MVLKFGAYAREPLINLIPHLKMRVSFLYGDMDWMDRDAADDLFEQNEVKRGSAIVTVPESGHNLLVDNPQFVAIWIYGQIFGNQNKTIYERKLKVYMTNRKKNAYTEEEEESILEIWEGWLDFRGALGEK